MEAIMDNKNFYDWVMSHEKVYSLLYSPSRIDNTPIQKKSKKFVVSFLKSMRICLRKDLLRIEVGLFSKVLSCN